MLRGIPVPLAATLLLAATSAVAVDANPEVKLGPPIAAKKSHDVVSPNGTRNDPYYWLRDDTRSKPEVLSYLKDENSYYAAQTAAYKDLTDKLSKEFIGRLKQDDSSVPAKWKDYIYYSRFVPGKEYPIQARHAVGSDKEQILVDGNKQAAGKPFYALGRRVISMNQALVAYLEDTTGRRQYTLKVRDIATGKDRPEAIKGLSPAAVWANDNKTIFYVENDPTTLLSTRVKRHVLGTDPKTDPVVDEEEDHSYYLGIDKSGDDKFILIQLRCTVADEILFIDAAEPTAAPKPLAKRTKDLL